MGFVRATGALGAAVSLPPVRAFSTQIAALPGLLGWYTARPQYCRIAGGKVAEWLSRSPGGPSFVETVAGGGPVLSADAAGVYSLGFASADATQMTWRGDFPLAAHTKVLIADITAPPSGVRYLLSAAAVGSTTGRHNLRTQTTSVSMQIDGGVFLSRPAAFDGPGLYVGAWNGATEEASIASGSNRLTIDGAGASVTQTALYLGGVQATPSGANTPDMKVHDVLIFDRDLVTDGRAAGALGLLESYAARVYGAG